MKPTRYHSRLSLVLLVASAFGWAALSGRVESVAAQSTEWSCPISLLDSSEMSAGSPVLLCDPYQNTHALWVEQSTTEALIYYSTEIGGAWSPANDIFVAPAVRLLDATVTPDATLHLVWVSGEQELLYSRAPLDRASDARAWQASGSLAQGLGVITNVQSGGGTIRSDSQGNLHVVFQKPNDDAAMSHTLYYLRSEDGGKSWSTPISILELQAPEPSYVSAGLEIDDSGRIHLVWDMRSREYASYSQLGYTRSTDDGRTWSDSRVLADGNGPFGAAMPSVFAFGDNEVHLTWDTPDRLHQWSYDGGETWSTPILIMDLGAAFGGFNKLAKDSSGRLHVVAATGDGVYHASWDGRAWNPKEAIDTRFFDPHGQQLVVCQGNRLHVAFWDRTGDQTVWYATRQVDALPLERQPLPESALEPTPGVSPEASHVAQPSGAAGGLAAERGTEPTAYPPATVQVRVTPDFISATSSLSTGNALDNVVSDFYLLVGILPAALFVGTVVLVRLISARKG